MVRTVFKKHRKHILDSIQPEHFAVATHTNPHSLLILAAVLMHEYLIEMLIQIAQFFSITSCSLFGQ